LPWGSCDNYWNTKSCVNPYDRGSLICWNEISARNGSIVKMCTVNHVNVTVADLTDPVKEFWESVQAEAFAFPRIRARVARI